MHGNRLEMITSQKLARLIEMNESSKSYHVIFAPVRGCIQKCYALRILDSSWRDNLIGGPICLDYMFLTTLRKNRGNPLRPFFAFDATEATRTFLLLFSLLFRPQNSLIPQHEKFASFSTILATKFLSVLLKRRCLQYQNCCHLSTAVTPLFFL